MVHYAVLQTDLRPLDFGLLGRAFRLVPGLTPYDANILGRDAFGVLVKDFPAEQASALQGALRAEGVETELVPQTDLPALPPAKLVQRLECFPEHLLVFDPLGNSFPLEWRHVLLVAAGAVRVNEFVRHQKPRVVLRQGRQGVEQQTEYDSVTREEQNVRLLGEIILAGGALRYSFAAEKFSFSALGPRRSGSVPEDFALFLRDLIRPAPHAGLNRGAVALRDGAAEFFSYPTKNAFHEEIVWMLWQIKKSA